MSGQENCPIWGSKYLKSDLLREWISLIFRSYESLNKRALSQDIVPGYSHEYVTWVCYLDKLFILSDESLNKRALLQDNVPGYNTCTCIYC